LRSGEFIEIDPTIFDSKEPPQILDEPYAEENINKRDSLLVDESTFLQEEDSPLAGQFETKNVIYKRPVHRPELDNFVKLNLDPQTEEFTEIIAYTEVGSETEEEPNKEEPENDFLTELEAVTFPVEEEEKPCLGTVENQSELDLQRAIPDLDDPEIITVPHKESGQRVRIRKDFKGARIVDLENKIVENSNPIDPKDYEIPKTVVDEEDVRFATLKAISGERIRVKRNFKGARIIDLEKRAQHPHAYLVGQTVENEQDFQFSNAYPDTEDPEVVVVMHNETGEDVKIRKTFQGATIVDDHGDAIPDAPVIDRTEYDIPKTIVDKEDVHLATLKHKITRERVRVRRNFKGAKIIDLEKKAELPPRTNEKFTHEPEPLSPDFSQRDLIPENSGWITSKPPRPLQPFSLSSPEEKVDPDRQRLANLASIITSYEQEAVSRNTDRGLEKGIDHSRLDMHTESDEESYQLGRKVINKPTYHNMDLERVYGNDPSLSMLDMEDSMQSLHTGNKRRRMKKKKKPEQSQRMKGLENIYLQRLDAKSKAQKVRPTKDEWYPEGEDWEEGKEEFMFPNKRGYTSDRIISSAGDEIVFGRSRQSPLKKD